jgi:hypothetical protein
MAEDDRGLYKWLSHVVGTVHIISLQKTSIHLRTISGCASYLVSHLRRRPLRNYPNASVSFAKLNVSLGLLEAFCSNWLCLDGKLWDFTSDLAKGDTAYTTLALGAHTDNTYYVRCILVLRIYW